MKIKVPFKFKFVFFEKELDFHFRISTLECATEEILKCDLSEVKDKDPIQLNIALFYAAYVTACRKKYKKPVYTLKHAEFWVTHMSKESQQMFADECKVLFGKMVTDSEEKKK